MEFVALHDELREELKEMAQCREDQAAIRSKKMRKWKTEMETAKKVNIVRRVKRSTNRLNILWRSQRIRRPENKKSIADLTRLSRELKLVVWVVLPLEGQDGINRKQPFDCGKVRITGKLFPKFDMERWEQSSFGGWSSFEGPDVGLWVYVPGILWKSEFSYVAQSYAPYSLSKASTSLLELDAQPGSEGLRYWVLESLGGSLVDVGHSIPWLAFHVGVLFPMLTRSHKYRSGAGKFWSTKGSREVQPSLRRGAGEDGSPSELLTLGFIYKYGEHTLKISHFFEAKDPEVPKGVVDARCGRLVLFVMVDSVCSKLVRGVLVLFLISDQVRSIA
ncbi:hypothetical protein F2Q68_00019213 [Brassica cretica]|uniref:Uncharacterized protein n=1 Tax=Brassica cretica TaxID=69181 RepID=A0A8S9G1W0_BRACR|nr:hypothetical protein F2Q68_00019213 [Brassica cretica]